MENRVKAGSHARETVITAAAILKALRNEGLDQFLLELRLPDRTVGRANSLSRRVTSLRDYALNRPHVLSADGKPIADEIVNRAVRIEVEYRGRDCPNVTAKESQDFHDALAREKQSVPSHVDLSRAPGRLPGRMARLLDRLTLENATKFLKDWSVLLATVATLLVAVTAITVKASELQAALCNNFSVLCAQSCTLEKAVREGCE